jgi:hypothetical protein
LVDVCGVDGCSQELDLDFIVFWRCQRMLQHPILFPRQRIYGECLLLIPCRS